MPKRENSDSKVKKQTNERRNSEEVDGVQTERARQRVSRACDRCKLKKSKCDGATRCHNCIGSESDCRYSAKRRREAREWYWNMQEVVDQAIQQLYWACRQKAIFPGILPDESSGQVTTEDILFGLGLITATGEIVDSEQAPNSLQGQHQSRRMLKPPDMVSNQTLVSPTASTSPSRTEVMSFLDSEPNSNSAVGTGGESRSGHTNTAMNFAMAIAPDHPLPHYGPSHNWGGFSDDHGNILHYGTSIDPNLPNMDLLGHNDPSMMNGDYANGMSPNTAPNHIGRYPMQSMSWRTPDPVDERVNSFPQQHVDGNIPGWNSNINEQYREGTTKPRRK